MSGSMLRNVICWVLVTLTPAYLVAADINSGSAMLYGRGTVWLNGKPLPRSSAVFPGDVIQTQPESVASLDASGSGVIVFPDSLVKFEGNAVSLDHGSFSVATSKGMAALARQVTVTPSSSVWTEFEIADNNGTLRVFANKGNVTVNCGKGIANLTEGEQAAPDSAGRCNKKKRRIGPLAPEEAHILANPYVQAGAVVTGGVIACLLLCNSSKSFVSPWKP
jgi:hypothetical protein